MSCHVDKPTRRHRRSFNRPCLAAVNGLYCDEQLLHEYGRAVKTVAIDPEYASRKSRQFVCGVGLYQAVC